MVIASFIVVVLWPVLLISHAGCVQDQAPGDDVAISDSLYRDDTGEISRDPRTKRLKTR